MPLNLTGKLVLCAVIPPVAIVAIFLLIYFLTKDEGLKAPTAPDSIPYRIPLVYTVALDGTRTALVEDGRVSFTYPRVAVTDKVSYVVPHAATPTVELVGTPVSAMTGLPVSPPEIVTTTTTDFTVSFASLDEVKSPWRTLNVAMNIAVGHPTLVCSDTAVAVWLNDIAVHPLHGTARSGAFWTCANPWGQTEPWIERTPPTHYFPTVAGFTTACGFQLDADTFLAVAGSDTTRTLTRIRLNLHDGSILNADSVIHTAAAGANPVAGTRGAFGMLDGTPVYVYVNDYTSVRMLRAPEPTGVTVPWTETVISTLPAGFEARGVQMHMDNDLPAVGFVQSDGVTSQVVYCIAADPAGTSWAQTTIHSAADIHMDTGRWTMGMAGTTPFFLWAEFAGFEEKYLGFSCRPGAHNSPWSAMVKAISQRFVSSSCTAFVHQNRICVVANLTIDYVVWAVSGPPSADGTFPDWEQFHQTHPGPPAGWDHTLMARGSFPSGDQHAFFFAGGTADPVWINTSGRLDSPFHDQLVGTYRTR